MNMYADLSHILAPRDREYHFFARIPSISQIILFLHTTKGRNRSKQGRYTVYQPHLLHPSSLVCKPDHAVSFGFTSSERPSRVLFSRAPQGFSLHDCDVVYCCPLDGILLSICLFILFDTWSQIVLSERRNRGGCCF